MGAVDRFEKLNPRQREAACFGPGPLLILAGAGTGKTNTLAHRVAHLVLKGVHPQRILLLTFSRRAALEMTRRATGCWCSARGRALRSTAGASETPELATITGLVRRSSQEFSRENFGGALYLATEAKSLANIARAWLNADRDSPRAGETRLAPPVRLKVSSRGNVREGPATTFSVLFSVNAGTMLTGVAYTDDWIRISDDQGRSGWIYRTLVGSP